MTETFPPWLADLIVPVFERLNSEEAAYSEAVAKAAKSRAEADKASAQYAGLLQVAKANGLTQAQVEAFCRHREEEERLKPAQPTSPKRDVMAAVVTALRNSPYPLKVSEIIDAVQAEGLTLPGSPEKGRANLKAYITRHHELRKVGRGLYTVDR